MEPGFERREVLSISSISSNKINTLQWSPALNAGKYGSASKSSTPNSSLQWSPALNAGKYRQPLDAGALVGVASMEPGFERREVLATPPRTPPF